MRKLNQLSFICFPNIQYMQVVSIGGTSYNVSATSTRGATSSATALTAVYSPLKVLDGKDSTYWSSTQHPTRAVSWSLTLNVSNMLAPGSTLNP